tara:strand:- start:119 stop:1282 length:1164 start_codon:yes stop_codon:yes gene_type:complete
MKPLKRPMFRSGGPIKEGIMDGMQDRPGYFIGGLIPLGMAAARVLPAAVRGFRAARTLTPGKLGTFGRIKDIFLPKKGLRAPMAESGEGAGFAIGSFARQNPLLALSTPSLATTAVTGAGPVALEAAKSGGKALANFLVPGERFDPFKEGGDKKTTETDTTGLKKVDSFDEVKKGGESVSQEKKEQLTADRIEENRKRYYKLMGIDKMKKGAAYDSLIDASKIIQQEGGDLKGAIKSGNLQSQIINAISKNLDSSRDLKKQIDAAILKGEIEKDIKSADTMDKRLKEAQIKRLERDEKQNTTAAKIAAVQIEKGAVTAADTAAILRSDGVEYTGALPDDEFLKFKKKNKGKDERDFLIENYGALDDGRYIVGGRLVEKRGDNVAFAI